KFGFPTLTGELADVPNDTDVDSLSKSGRRISLAMPARMRNSSVGCIVRLKRGRTKSYELLSTIRSAASPFETWLPIDSSEGLTQPTPMLPRTGEPAISVAKFARS